MTITNLFRALFYSAVAAVIYVSVLPSEALVPTVFWDKLEHAAAYFVLGLLGAAAYRNPAHRLPLAVGLVTLGAALEIAQTQVPGRSGDIADCVANCVGVLLAIAAGESVRRLRPNT